MFGSSSVRLARGGTVTAGHVASFEVLYDRTFDAVYRFVYRATHNRSDAEDLTSETYERALRGLPRFRGSDADMDGWVYGIARNVLREWWRDRDRQHTSLAPIEQLQMAASTVEEPPQEVELAQLIGHLTPQQREVLDMRLSGLKVREVAIALGKAEGTVKALQFAALKNLRKAANIP